MWQQHSTYLNGEGSLAAGDVSGLVVAGTYSGGKNSGQGDSSGQGYLFFRFKLDPRSTF